MSLTEDESLTPGLYLCPTPIGNLEDITLRVLKVLALCDAVAAEDTRHSLKLLNHYGIRKRLISCHEHNSRRRGPEIAEEIRQGRSVALVSDAGMPGISDPGAEILRLCVAEGLPVTVLPGPSASLTALVASGLGTDRFMFWGFPERQGKRRKAQLEAMVRTDATVILYESPHRITATLQDLVNVGGDRPAVLAREITKRYEEYLRGTLLSLKERLTETPPKGELVLLFEGGMADTPAEYDLDSAMDRLLAEGLPKKEIARRLAEETGESRNAIYQALLARQDGK